METLRANLDDAQLEAAAILDRNVMVLAGPGSGKTHLLVHRVGFLLRSSPDDQSRVLCLTFTVEAAKEMRRRLKDLAPPGRLSRVAVMNFHQFSLDLLRHYGHLTGLDREFGVLGEADRAELVEEVIASLPFGRVNVGSVIAFISKRKARREYRGDLLRDLDAKSLQATFTEYERRRTRRNALDFDDLILKAVELLEQVDGVRRLVRLTFPHIEIDELHDTSLLQLTLLQLMYEPDRSRVFAVADDDQMVYEWRDARPETLGEYEDFFNADVIILRHNYRCPRKIVEAANALIANNTERREKLVVAIREDTDGRITLSPWRSQEDQASFVARSLLSSNATDGRPCRDHAVLVRVRASLAPIRTALEEVGIPFVEVGGRDVEYSPFVRILLGALRYVAGEPHGAEAIRRACNKANEMLESEVFEPKEVRAIARQEAEEFDQGFIAALARELNMLEILEDYGETAEALRIERFLMMVDLARSESIWQDHACMLRTLLVEFGSLLDRVNMQHDAVRLMTVHGAKGLQFPVVFIPDLCDGAFPNLRFRSRKPNVAEERRLLFVALTRAQEEVHLSWSDEGPWGYPVSPSPFVDEIVGANPNHVEWLNQVG